MSARYKPQSIREQGLKQYLDGEKGKHPRGYGYEDFIWLWLCAELPRAAIARAMNRKSAAPVKEWQAIYHEEQGNAGN